MKTHNTHNIGNILIILLCTLLIISTNYIFTRAISGEVEQIIMEKEYTKLGGKENYDILKQIQKAEMISYIDKLKEEEPATIFKLRQDALVEETRNENLLTWDAIQELEHSNTSTGNSHSKITLIEFSDFDCSYCVEYHNKKSLKEIVQNNSDINLVFKNFPLPSHENAFSKALIGKCIEKISGSDAYYHYIDTLFAQPESLNLDNITQTITDLELNHFEFNSCYNDKNSQSLVQTEFDQGMKLGIKTTPSTVVINNETGEFEIIEGNVEKENIDVILEGYLN